MYAIAGIKDAGAVDLMFDIMFIDPITVRHFRQFQGIWRYHLLRQKQYKLWWDTFRAFLRDCFDKTRTQMNHYHKENPPDPDTIDSDDEATDQWFPGTPKMHLPSHKREAPLVITASASPQKKQKRDKLYPFKGCLVKPGDYDGPGDFPVFHSMVEWFFTGVKDVCLETVFHAVFSLCGSWYLELIMGCLVQASEMLACERMIPRSCTMKTLFRTSSRWVGIALLLFLLFSRRWNTGHQAGILALLHHGECNSYLRESHLHPHPALGRGGSCMVPRPTHPHLQ